MTAATDSFFDESREQSVVKAEIVEKYFDAWAGIITGAQDRLRSGEKRIAYVDLFAGPGRYKDGAISTPLHLVNTFVKDWGCDCIFFFNYNRINAGLSNASVHEHMCALFGDARARSLAERLEPMSPAKREATIVNELALALKQDGARYVLPFCFKSDTGKRTTHHLVLVTKGFKGYEVMKDIMARASSSAEQGVPSFAYSPAVDRQQTFLFELNRPLDDLRAMLLTAFAGQTLTMRKIYEDHSVDRPFLSRHYKEVLATLERENVITTRGRRTQRGFADDILVTFPRSRS